MYSFETKTCFLLPTLSCDRVPTQGAHILSRQFYIFSQQKEHPANRCNRNQCHSQSYFIHVFKKATSLTPNQYRSRLSLID